VARKIIPLDFTDTVAVEALFNEAFQHPHRKYTVRPNDVEVAAMWLKEYTSMVNFVWCAGVKEFDKRLKEAGPMRLHQVTHLDTLYYRDRCGWAAGSWHCDYPGSDDDADWCYDDECEECEEQGRDAEGEIKHKRICLATGCPIAWEADREDLKKYYPSLYKSDYKDVPDEEPHDWMILHSRPRYAYVPNVTVLGCENIRRW